MNFSRFITKQSSLRRESPIRKTTAIALQNSDILSLASGMPNPRLFPFKSIDIVAKSGEKIHFGGSDMDQALQQHSFISKHNLRPMGCNLLPVETDKYGMMSSSLQTLMDRWKPTDATDPDSGIPRLLYTVPNGGNPTGATATLQRKKEIYEIAQKYNMLIIEDDPYFFLQFQDPVPSYQSIDVDGRVIRSDSMSKVMSSGLRLGWVSGANPFIQRIILHQQASILHTSTLVQMMMSRLFDEWGMEGFTSHIQQIKDFYKKQRDVCLKACSTHLTGLAEWNEPTGGMFLWIKLNGIADTTDLLQRKALEKKVLVLPGSVFEVVEGTPSAYCRISYSFATEETMNEALRRLADLIKDEKNSC